MKFGKSLIQAIHSTNPEWAPFWINYKVLKKCIKAVVVNHGGGDGRKIGHGSEQALTECPEEITFFKNLRDELRKLNCFYLAEEKRCIFRFQQLTMVHDEVMKRQDTDDISVNRLMSAWVHFYKECVRLENFALTNYVGFSKILKKHDKMTGYTTRTQYMRKMVNQSSFANNAHLLLLLENTEARFHEINRDNVVIPTIMQDASEMHQKIQERREGVHRMQHEESERENNLNPSHSKIEIEKVASH